MNSDKVKKCELAARLFIDRVQAWREATRPKKYFGSEEEYIPSAPKESAALRRMSMELTRALAEMRKPN